MQTLSTSQILLAVIKYMCKQIFHLRYENSHEITKLYNKQLLYMSRI